MKLTKQEQRETFNRHENRRTREQSREQLIKLLWDRMCGIDVADDAIAYFEGVCCG